MTIFYRCILQLHLTAVSCHRILLQCHCILPLHLAIIYCCSILPPHPAASILPLHLATVTSCHRILSPHSVSAFSFRCIWPLHSSNGNRSSKSPNPIYSSVNIWVRSRVRTQIFFTYRVIGRDRPECQRFGCPFSCPFGYIHVTKM